MFLALSFYVVGDCLLPTNETNSEIPNHQCFSLEEDSKSDEELMELYEEQTREKTNENMETENMESLETMLEAEDISNGMCRK